MFQIPDQREKYPMTYAALVSDEIFLRVHYAIVELRTYLQLRFLEKRVQLRKRQKLGVFRCVERGGFFTADNTEQRKIHHGVSVNESPNAIMNCYKKYLVLFAWIVLVAADYEYERSRDSDFHGDQHLSDSWYHGPHDGYYSASEAVASHNYKKIPTEIKNMKKGLMPYYTLTGKEDPKFKDKILKSGAPHCQEIKKKRSSAGGEKSDKKMSTCYTCKDPKKGLVFEHCSFKSQPQPGSSSSSPRYRRSQLQNGDIEGSASTKEDLPKDSYRFGEEFFSSASDEIPAEYKKHAEHCDKVVKDSMVCMVCKDPKTNGKYEQCSYVSQPKEKQYAYSKSSSYGKPEKSSSKGEEENPEEAQERQDYKVPESSVESHEAYATKDKAKSKKYNEGFERSKEAEESADCKQVEREKEICTICKDPKTGENYEKCSYNFQPNDKIYKYTRSKSFGYPETTDDTKNPEKTVKKSSEEEAEESAEFIADYSIPSSSKYYKFDAEPSEKQETEKDEDEPSKYSESREEESPWKNSKPVQSYPSYSLEKKIPSTSSKGGLKYSVREPEHSEEDSQVNYETSASKNQREEVPRYLAKEAKSPEDTSSKYSSEESSSPYGDYLLSNRRKFYDSGPTTDYVKSESEKIAESIDVSNCQKVQKDSMTCTVCKDPKTGGKSEQCFYSYQPDDKLFSYSKSKSFGTPRESEDEASKESSDKKETYSHHPYKYSESKPYPTIRDPVETKTANFESRKTGTESGAQESRKSKTGDAVDAGFYDTSNKKAEIDKFLKEFQNEDHVNCKKVSRNKMTCYQCVDETGVQKEECVFVQTGQEPEVDHAVHRNYPNESESREATRIRKRKPRQKVESEVLEPTAAASETVQRVSEPAESEEEEVEGDKNQIDRDREAEAYDYAAETRPRYDKVFGMTLPEYMLTISEHEAAFDETVASARDQ
ncbi:axoneme-associated protein mst101(2)-like [Prorops nasuta]|uniref:axoneme-associated protein mst101(2)-like n=1 Tax=Prorops nasuta TaxID=863751 RepID=UPI0034CD4642